MTFQPIIGIGFTGTQQGLTALQRNRLRSEIAAVIKLLQVGFTPVFQHGDCIGADMEFDAIVRSFGAQRIIHPPTISAKRAFCVEGATVRDPQDYLTRNLAIIAECSLIFACPKETTEQLRSGTWATIRYARKAKRDLRIIWPDGEILVDGHKFV